MPYTRNFDQQADTRLDQQAQISMYGSSSGGIGVRQDPTMGSSGGLGNWPAQVSK